jgi:hypothetical protein
VDRSDAGRELIPEVVKEVVKEGKPDQGPKIPTCDLTGLSQEKFKTGISYFGRNRYIKYVPGTLPIIISSPHGGSLKPSEIKSRTYGVLGSDSYSREYTYEVARRLYQLTGQLPHIIINRLHRSKLDANRAIKEASQGDKWSEQAWREYRDYILEAKRWVSKRCKTGHYFDMHTNAHSEKWVEFGFLLRSSELALSDNTLNTNVKYRNKSSVKWLASLSKNKLASILRGNTSLGTMMQARGYKSVPSNKYPDPSSGGYFSGGYNTATYGSKNGGTIDGTQVETYVKMIERGPRYNYSRALAESILSFVENWYGFKLKNPITTVPHSLCSRAKSLKFQSRKINLIGTTWGALAQYPGQINCGTSSNLRGSQVYYQFPVSKGKTYTIRLKPDFPARVFLFASACDVSAINKSCKATKINGILAAAGLEKVISYKPSSSGTRKLAVGSLFLHWLGRFQLQIIESP